MIFAHVQQHLNPMLGSLFIATFMLAMNGPRGVITCSRGSPGESTGSYTFKVCENEGKLGGNQLPDGSIGLSSLRRRRTICPSVSARALARDSPDFAFFWHISRVFPRVALTQTTLKITVCGRCACVCACVVVYCVCCVLCCAFL